MNEANATHAILFGMPMVKQWDENAPNMPTYYLDNDYIALELEQWAELIEKYPDRFMIGSDKVGHWETYPEEITKYYTLLDSLQEETVKKICYENILKPINVYDGELRMIS